MELLFKIITLPAPAKPSVGDTNFSEHYAGVNTSMSWGELKSAVRQATQKFVLPFVSEEWYTAFVTKYHALTLTNPERQVLEYLQDAVAHYAIYYILPQKATAVASLGVVQNGPDGGAQPAPQWALHLTRQNALEQADSALDRALAAMDKQVALNDANFTLWKNSKAYKNKTSDFFRQTAQVDDFLNIKDSRRTYVSLIPFFRQVEQRTIKSLLCTALYNEMLLPTVTAQNQKLLPMLLEAVAYLGAAEALPHHRVVLDGDGFVVVSKTDGQTDKRNLSNSVHEQAVGALLSKYQESGRNALKQLKDFLEANLTDYPTYESSSCRETPTSLAHGMMAGEGWVPNAPGMVGIL